MNIINSVTDYIELLYYLDSDFKGEKFFYRGHSSKKYKLLPSVFRSGYTDKEDFLYHEIMVRCPEHFNNKTHLDKLVMMQHYGICTRLLDVTANPLVALYFACRTNTDQGLVIAFGTDPSDILYSDSDRALILACLPRLKPSERKELYDEAITRMTDSKVNNRKKFEQTAGGRTYKSYVVEKLYHEICTELPSFKRELNPADLLAPLFIQPNKTNDRILKQDGAFIVSGLSKDFLEAENKLQKLVRLEVLVENKSQILKELDFLCINEASLFPEVDHVADYLKKKMEERNNWDRLRY